MAEWVVINKDIDIINGAIMGATFAMQVPGGMIVRNLMNSGASSMVFVPDPNHPAMSAITVDDVIEKWIEDNKVTK